MNVRVCSFVTLSSNLAPPCRAFAVREVDFRRGVNNSNAAALDSRLNTPLMKMLPPTKAGRKVAVWHENVSLCRSQCVTQSFYERNCAVLLLKNTQNGRKFTVLTQRRRNYVSDTNVNTSAAGSVKPSTAECFAQRSWRRVQRGEDLLLTSQARPGCDGLKIVSQVSQDKKS